MREWLKEFQGLLGVVVGALLGWLTSRYQLRYQVSRDRKKLILEKLEELHELLSKYSYGLFSMMHQHTVRQLEEIASRIIPPRLMPKRPEADVEIVSEDRLRALVGFYAPELTDDLEALEKLGGDFGEMMVKSEAGRALDMLEEKVSQNQGVDDKTLAEQFEKIYKACENLQRRVVALSKKYT
jgi:hypothetical protein